MKKNNQCIFVALILLFIPFKSYSQIETVKKTISKEPYKEIFFVLKSNKSILNGSYEKLFLDKLIIKGEYSDNIKKGKWYYYNSFGDLEFCYDYSVNQIVEFNKKFTPDFKVWLDSNMDVEMGQSSFPIGWQKTKLYTLLNFSYYKKDSTYETPPFYSDGNIVFQDMIFVNLMKSVKSIDHNTMSIISLTIDTLGFISDYEVLAKSNFNFEEKFVKKIKESKMRWVSACKNGHKVESKYILPILFQSFRSTKGSNHEVLFSVPELLPKIKNTENTNDVKVHSWKNIYRKD